MTDPERPADTTRVDPAAAEQPGVESPRRPSFRQRWAHVISSTHPPRQWAVIAAAIRTADAVPSDEFGEPVVRGDEAWCRVAVTALESPSSATAAQRLPDALPQRCLADADLLWAWLNAPAVYSHDGRIVADGLDLVDWGTASDEATHQAVENLLTQAQDAGVFGVRGYRVEAQVVDTDDAHAGYLLVARPEFGPGLASTPLADEDLNAAQATSPVDGAVLMLASAAAVVDATLDIHDAAHHDASTSGLTPAGPRRGHAFPAPQDDGATTTAEPATPPPEPPAPTRNPRGR